MDLIYIWYHDKHVYWSKVFMSTISTHDSDLGVEVTLRILKMLKFSFTFLRPYYFLTLLIHLWFDEYFAHCNPPTSTPTPTGHVKIKVTDLEFSRNKLCNIRRAILSGDRSCFVLVFFSPLSIGITSLREERANLSAFHTFVRFAFIWFCLFLLPPGVWEGLRLVILALPGLFSYLFCCFWQIDRLKTTEHGLVVFY